MSSDFFPISIEFIVDYEVVKVLVFLGLLEREDSLHNDEQDNSCRKYVDLSSVVLLSLFDFWSHVCHGSSVRF